MRDVLECCEIKNKWQANFMQRFIYAKTCLKSWSNTTKSAQKANFFCTYCIIGIVCFSLSPAAVVHLTHIIKGGSVETRGALNASPAALQRKTVEFLVPAPLPLWRSHVSLTCWWQLEAGNNAVPRPQWVPRRFTLGPFVSSFIHFPSFKRISSTKIGKRLLEMI